MRYGSILLDSECSIVLPALVDVPTGGPLLLVGPGARRSVAVAGIHSLVLRSLAALPAGLVQCHFVDPVASGRSAERFMALADVNPALVGGSVAVDGRDIDELMAAMTEHVEKVARTWC